MGVVWLSVWLCVVGVCVCVDLSAIKHIVIFMQENRAFDHYYGHAKGVRGFDDRAAICMSSGHSTFYQPLSDPQTPYMLPWHMDSLTTNGVCGDAPQMDYPTDINMWNNGKLDQWNIARDPGLGMAYFKRTDLPYYYGLIDGFTVGDQYYQSTFTQTNPNRLHLFSGSNGLSVGQKAVLDNHEPRPGFTWETMGETLENAGITWHVYQEQNNFDDNAFAWFENYQKAKPGSPLYDNGMVRVPNGQLVNAFQKDVESGALPQVSWLIAPDWQSEHAEHMPPVGEDLSAQFIAVLKKNPNVYNNTLFIIDYDEGGQFYDHSWTATPPVSDDDGKSTVTTQGEVTDQMQPIGLGFRVPLILVSPFTRGGWVCSEIFDHTSVIKLIEQKFGVHCPNISPWRRAMVGDLTTCLDMENPDYSWPFLPSTALNNKMANFECTNLPPPVVPVNQTMPSQEPGTRPSRALPYELSATGSANATHFTLFINNTGSGGAPFYLFDNLTRTNPPRKYAVESGKGLSDTIELSGAGSNYDFILFGPNGFVRSFAGDGSVTEPIVTLVYQKETQNVIVNVERPVTRGFAEIKITVTPNAYLNSSHAFLARRPTFSVHKEGTSIPIPVATSGNWYDFTITSTTTTLSLVRPHKISVPFSRRFMGRMETGKPSISDPATEPGLCGDGVGVGGVEHPMIPDKYRGWSKSKIYFTHGHCLE